MFEMPINESIGAVIFVPFLRASCWALSASVASIFAMVGRFAEVTKCDDRPGVPNFFLSCLDSAACDKGWYLGTLTLAH